jgi:hypothetical protein
MNERIQKAMNSENLGARIMGNGVLDQKIWALKALKGKMVFSGDSKGICGILKWLESFGAKDRGSCKVWGFFGDFGGFLECLEWVGAYL